MKRFLAVVDFLASIRLAIPLLVVIAAATIVGSVIPQGENVELVEDAPQWVRDFNDYLQLNDIFHSWWFVALLVLLGVSLLAITVKRIPPVVQQRGLGPGLGILLAHLGALMVLGAVAYGSLSGFRYYVRIIEGEVAVLPTLPFVVKLERFDFQYYPRGTFEHRGPNFDLPKAQDSTLVLYRHGDAFERATASPGRPLRARGVTLLPADRDMGWAFDIVLAAGGVERVVPILPWAPPLVTLGLGNTSRIVVHKLQERGANKRRLEEDPAALEAEVFLLVPGEGPRSLGFASQSKPVELGAWKIGLGPIRRYTGLHIYRRPEIPYLIAGSVILGIGLIGYFTRWGLALLPGRRVAAPVPEEAGRNV